MFIDLARTADAISSTAGRIEKEEILATYLRSLDDPSLERATLFFTGSAFALRDQRVTGVGWASILDAVAALTGLERDEIRGTARKLGDAGDAVAAFMPEVRLEEPPLSVVEVGDAFDELADTSRKIDRTEILEALFRRSGALEARYIAKILMGELRIGGGTGLVEGAIRRAFDRKLQHVRRATMLTNDLGAVALLARADALDSASVELFQPIGMMLAQAEEDPSAILDHLGEAALADDKYDGVRAQIHTDGSQVRIYSRTMDAIDARFPELAEAARALPTSAILDGEIVAFDEHILPFAALQVRLGRRKVTSALLEKAPVRFFAFDVLYADGQAMIDRPLQERLQTLRSLVEHDGIITPGFQQEVHSADEIERAFEAARARANEGLVVKDPRSLYTPGRRGKSWLKYKKALATLDCVVTAAETGHGKRRNLLSDLTFAVRRDDELVNIGKAYSGLTDSQIEALTERFRRTTIQRFGPVHLVEPAVVLEIAFDRIQESKRHKSGYALRFPRIARIREDKSIGEISTIDEVRRIYQGQLVREKPVAVNGKQ